uniref:Zinc/iron permease n=1 Tax=Mycena chlorophos TaxID=658473 RepID=A0ABQ0LCH3_MYCCL|nr:Zinc/iron permease [Mycena chlorophos]
MPRRSFTLLLLTLLVALVAAETGKHDEGGFMPGPEVPIFAEELEDHCQPIWRLSMVKKTLEAEASPVMRKVFAVLFPFGPAWNSILGTFYISSVPNFILAFIPAQINANTLNTMTAFATGGLLSDVFLHLIPHAFMGEHHGDGVQFVMVEEKRNILIGLGIFVGFAAFFMMEKTLRVLGGEEGGEGHSHSHSHSHSENKTTASGVATGSENGAARSRKGSKKSEAKEGAKEEEDAAKSAAGPSKMSAYLNLFGDFVHNITDGLAMAASFYASPLIGATTTLACFAHEIPHEIADYSILIRSGFTKRQAMQSQFVTAVGAFVGTFIGIAVASGSGASHSDRVDLAAAVRQEASGLLGTTTQLSDLVIPFVAGGFLYIGAVAVLPTWVGYCWRCALLRVLQTFDREQERGSGAARVCGDGGGGLVHVFGRPLLLHHHDHRGHASSPPFEWSGPAPRDVSRSSSLSLPASIWRVTGPCRFPKRCPPSPHLRRPAMGTKGRTTPRVVCCAIPIARQASKILLITSRKRPDNWVLPKGGWEASDVRLENAASREALEEAGVRGTISRYVTTQQTPSTIYHFYELDVASLEQDWLESNERRREWVDYAEAVRRLEWKVELANGLRLCTLAPSR